MATDKNTEWETIRVNKNVYFIKKDGEGKSLWYKVEGKTGKYNVKINFSCDCRWSSLYPNIPCSHIKAALKRTYNIKKCPKKKFTKE